MNPSLTNAPAHAYNSTPALISLKEAAYLLGETPRYLREHWQTQGLPGTEAFGRLKFFREPFLARLQAERKKTETLVLSVLGEEDIAQTVRLPHPQRSPGSRGRRQATTNAVDDRHHVFTGGEPSPGPPPSLCHAPTLPGQPGHVEAVPGVERPAPPGNHPPDGAR